MAAIGRRTFVSLALMLASSTVVCQPLLADKSDDVRARVGYFANALSAGEPADAMSVFDKSFAKYEAMRENIEGLTNGFDLNNEVDVTTEESTDGSTKLTLNWTLTLTNRFSNEAERRNGEVTVTFAQKNGKWMIADLAPIDFFSPLKKPIHKR